MNWLLVKFSWCFPWMASFVPSELSSRLDIISSTIYYLIKWKYKCQAQPPSSRGVPSNSGSPWLVFSSGMPPLPPLPPSIAFCVSICELTGGIPMIDLPLCTRPYKCVCSVCVCVRMCVCACVAVVIRSMWVCVHSSVFCGSSSGATRA